MTHSPLFILCLALAAAPLARAEAPAAAAVPAGSANASAPGSAAPSASPSLTAGQMKEAARVDTVTIPSPGELMTALNKEAKPNWQSEYRPPIPTLYNSRVQIALNVGTLIADGYIALEAEDSQQIKNLGKDIITLAKSLAVSESVIARGNSIVDFADNNEWSALKEELEATQNEVKLALEQQHDTDLVSLVTLGGWIRGTAVVSSWIASNYTPETAKLLRQPGIVANMRQKLASLPEKVQADPLLRKIAPALEEIEALVSFPTDKAPTEEQVVKLKEITSGLVTEMAKKQETK